VLKDTVNLRLQIFLYREHAPSIIFMDEIDSIGSSRIESGGSGLF
jgi:ATP-dependent 26S proteasome regulatory subunit